MCFNIFCVASYFFFFLTVDKEIYLHTEEDPRYRGAAIPSKAFKMLQHMTDGNNLENNNGMRILIKSLKDCNFMMNFFLF